MRKLTIKINTYPANITFSTTVVLPTFSYGCEARGKLLVAALKRKNIDSPIHDYGDYTVEFIERVGNTEIWEIGS